MVKYNFYLGYGSSVVHACSCETDTRGSITDCSTSDRSGSKTQGSSSAAMRSSLEAHGTGSTPSDSDVTCYTIQDIETMYQEIIEFIMSNELRKFEIPSIIDEDKLLEKVLQELNYELFFDDGDDDSDNLFGYSDIVSVSSDSTLNMNEMCGNFNDIMLSIRNTYSYLGPG